MKKVAAWFTQYPLYKLASLLIATGLWLVQRVAYNPIQETTSEIPVQVEGLSKGWDILNKPKQVDLRLRGSALLLGRATEEAKAWIDVADLAPGEYEVSIEAQVMRGVEVLGVEPKTVLITLEELDAKEFTITSKIEGAPAPGYECAKERVRFDPNTVKLTGLRSKFRQVHGARVTLHVADRDKPFKERRRVEPVDSQGDLVRAVQVEPSTTVATVPIEAIKIVAIELVVEGTPAEGYAVDTLTMSPQSVKLRGPLVKEVESIKTEPLIVSDAWMTIDQQLSLQFPPGVRGDLQQVDVTVEIYPLETGP